MSPFGTAELTAILGYPPSQEQAAVIFAPLGDPAVVIAGAGSGKTSLMVARMLTLIGRGDCQPDQILGLTFTRKAAGELAGRLDQALRGASRAGLIPADLAQPEVSTYHSFAQRVVREHGLRVGIDPDGRVETEFTLRPLAFRSAADLDGLADVDHNLSLGAAAKALISLDGELAEHMVTTDALRAREERRLAALSEIAKPVKAVQEVLRATRLRIVLSYGVDDYRRRKLDEGVFDYADLTRFAAQIAEGSPAAVEALREQHVAVLLDEYQDTSVVQRRMLQSMFGGGHPVVAVGDPKQSIYGFRGAASANITEFPEHFRRSDGLPAEVFTLSTNFRSGPGILTVANELATVDGMAHGEPLVPSGTVETARVEVDLFQTRDEEEATLVARVAAELESGRKPEQVLLLAATNKDVARLADRLTAAGIEVSSSDLSGLLSESVVQDVLSYAAVLSNPAANTDLLRLLIGPRWNVGLRDLALLGSRAAELADVEKGVAEGDLEVQLRRAVMGSDPIDIPALLDAVMDPGTIGLSPDALSRLAEFGHEFTRLGRHVSEPVPELLLRIIRESGMDVEVLLDEHAPAREAALDALVSLAAQWSAANPLGGLRGFLRAVAIARSTELKVDFEPPEGHGRVRVMTVHKAKGLEAEVVLIPGMTARAFDEASVRGSWLTDPSSLPDDLRGDLPGSHLIVPEDTASFERHKDEIRSRSLAERSRLTYVALTRAAKRLIVSGHHWAPGLKGVKDPSRHLVRIADHPDSVVGSWPEEPGDTNPDGEGGRSVPFPFHDERTRQRLTAAAELVWAAEPADVEADTAHADPEGAGAPVMAAVPGDDALSASEAALIARWDADMAALAREREQVQVADVEVVIPGALSVTGAQALIADPQGFALQLRRPMPRPPAAQARLGSRFHEWVAQRWSQHPLIDAIEWAADAELAEPPPAELAALQRAFEESEFADRVPAAIEFPFTVTLAGTPISGQIDAVYADDDGWEVVDWKTGARQHADPLQLAIYRVAWARIKGVPLSDVQASFFYVARSERVPQNDLPDEAGIEEMLRSRLLADEAPSAETSAGPLPG